MIEHVDSGWPHVGITEAEAAAGFATHLETLIVLLRRLG
jgi:hypothetical protein